MRTGTLFSLPAFLLLASASVVRADVSADDLWFFADFDRTAEMDGFAFTDPIDGGAFDEGRFGKGYRFVSDLKRADGKFWVVKDRLRLSGFPFAAGTFSCWFRSPEEHLGEIYAPGFGFCAPWKLNWVWRGDSFRIGTNRKDLVSIKGWKRSTAWRHFAAVWDAEAVTLYLDGERVASSPTPERPDMSRVENAVFRIGSGFDGSPPANQTLDEIAVFRRPLAPDEVRALARATGPLLPAGGRFSCDAPAFPFFWRNQRDAAVRTAIHAPAACTVRAVVTLGGRRIADRPLSLACGTNPADFPFDPSRYAAGTCPWRIVLTASDGATLLDRGGEARIFPRRARDAFKFFSWGGWRTPPSAYLRSLGINSLNVPVERADLMRAYVADGFFPNPRYEVFRRDGWKDRDCDGAAIEARARRDFAYLKGLHVWVTTLVNSEVYSSRYPQSATNHPRFHAAAERALGFKPDFRYRNAPIEVDRRTLGDRMPRGVIERGACPQLDTLAWVMRAGMAPYPVNRHAARGIRAVDPGNVVWSEPVFEGIAADLDMVAGWQYDYGKPTVLWHLRNQYAYCRAYGKAYQPTMDGAYYVEVWGRHPEKKGADGRPAKVEMVQSLDEITVSAWMSLGAVPAASLAFFYVDAWYKGEADGIVEPGTSARFGERWRTRLAPAADLLRGLPNLRAPVAVVVPEEGKYASGLEWGQYHYPLDLSIALAREGVPYDVIHDREIMSGAVASYPVALLPLARTLYREHADKLDEAAAAGCRIVTGPSAAKAFAGGIRRDTFTYRYKRQPVLDEAATWYPAVAARLRPSLPAWSDTDGKTSWTFLKSRDGVGYAVVVNDARADDPGFYGKFVTNGWFRTIGTPKTIRTRFNVPPGSAIYEFNAADGRHRVACTRAGAARETTCTYGPAEGRVFCVYPRELKRLDMDYSSGALELTLSDAGGGAAPGRQVVELTVRDPAGRVHDASGRYVMERGRLRVPVLFADTDDRGTFFRRWKAQARELTSGLGAKESFYRR